MENVTRLIRVMAKPFVGLGSLWNYMNTLGSVTGKFLNSFRHTESFAIKLSFR